jgi:hypothetical protein
MSHEGPNLSFRIKKEKQDKRIKKGKKQQYILNWLNNAKLN